MTDLKPISPEGIPQALERAERYRLLNEPGEAESICRDVLRVDAGNQRAIVTLLLALTDKLRRGGSAAEARELVDRIEDPYARAYYEGIVYERQGKALLDGRTPGSETGAYGWIVKAMGAFEHAEASRPPGNDEAILRWNACARLLRDRGLGPRPEDAVEHPIE